MSWSLQYTLIEENYEGKTMSKKLFVGGLPFAVTQDQLKTMFSEFGTVTEATIITDRFTRRSKGFGFVSYDDDAAADAAIAAMNDKEVEGRKIVVNEARPMTERPERRSFDGPRREFSRPGFRSRREF